MVAGFQPNVSSDWLYLWTNAFHSWWSFIRNVSFLLECRILFEENLASISTRSSKYVEAFLLAYAHNTMRTTTATIYTKQAHVV